MQWVATDSSWLNGGFVGSCDDLERAVDKYLDYAPFPAHWKTKAGPDHHGGAPARLVLGGSYLLKGALSAEAG